MKLLFLRLRTWYKLHKWTAIIAGIALLMWLITGLTLTWRQLFPIPPLVKSTAYDYRSITLSPPDVIQLIEESRGKPVRLRGLNLEQLLDIVVYRARLESGEIVLLNAISGDLIEITPEFATDIARRSVSVQAEVQGVSRIDNHSVDYPYGPIPVYEVVFNDDRETRAYITVGTGEIWHSERGDRIRQLLGSLHTFDALRFFTNRRRLITGFLVLTSLITIFVPLLGYYLALPRRWQVLNRRR